MQKKLERPGVIFRISQSIIKVASEKQRNLKLTSKVLRKMPNWKNSVPYLVQEIQAKYIQWFTWAAEGTTSGLP